MRHRSLGLLQLLGVLAVLALPGCGVLPDSGPVHTVRGSGADQRETVADFNPPGPAKDASPTAIATGFLVAMQANPLSTSAVRSFLSRRAHDTWRPDRGTVVYERYTVTGSAQGAQVRLADPRRLDPRGGWIGGAAGRTETLTLQMVSEKGQWRIDNPPDTLLEPASYFDRSFSRFDLYFFDQTGRVLLPDPVFIPRGPESATKLVRSLLAGPGPAIADVARSAFPPATSVGLSVSVSERGLAEVPLSRDVLRLSRQELGRAVAQLVWTLRQVPGVERVRVTVGGTAVPLANGLVDAPVTTGAQYDASGAGAPFLWGLRAGRVVDLGAQPNPVPGAFAKPGYALRSLAVSQVPRRIAAVSGNGHAVFLASAQDASTAGRPIRIVSGATDVLRPQYDLFGDLWLLDRTRSGARVLLVRGREVRQIDVPGVTGADVAAFSVAYDGSRIAVAYAGTPAPPLRVVDVLRTEEGVVSGTGRAQTFPDGRVDGARIVDLGWRDPATLAVLTRPTADTSQVEFISADGSPVAADLLQPNVFNGVATQLVVAPDRELPVRVLTADQQLHTLDDTGSWSRTTTRVLAAAYAR